MNTLTDGIYAIAMTILVLNIEVQNVPHSAQSLLKELLSLHSLFFHYVIGFVILAMFWSIHHKQYRRIVHVDRTILWLNLVCLMFVALVPFSTSLLADYNYITIVAMFFHCNILAISLFSFFGLRHAVKVKSFISDDIPRDKIAAFYLQSLAFPVVALLGIGISFLSSEWSTLVYLLVPIIMSIHKRSVL